MSNLGKLYSKKTTPQTQKADKRQVRNSAGGYTFKVDSWGRFRRFLILGSDKGSYYAGKQQLVRENAEVIEACIEQDGRRAVDLIIEVSDRGVPNNDTCLFALALAAAADDAATRRYALDNLHRVARIGTHLFHFADFVQEFRGWGRALRRGIADWYMNKPVDALAYQVAKYRQRDGWTHGDLLRLAHPVTDDPYRETIYQYALGKPLGGAIPEYIWATEQAKGADKATTIRLITDHGLTREMIDTQHLNDADVQRALLEKMPLTAMVRNLGNMSKSGLLTDFSEAAGLVISRLEDAEYLQKSRLHPYQILLAQKTYGKGSGFRGAGSWVVASTVVEALESAFYKAFDFVEPSEARTLIGLDVSGSMGWSIDGILTAAEKAAAMCMVSARTEPQCIIRGFSNTFKDMGITRKDSLDSVLRKTRGVTFDRTDCALPMVYAKKQKLEVDAFIVYTDNETYHGRVHPHQALNAYRKAMGIDAKLVVVGTEANDFSIADPSDHGMLDVVGFDATAPKLIADFIRGDAQ